MSRRVTILGNQLVKIQKEIKKIVDFFDREHLGLMGRVERIEHHLNLPSN
jgi:hypothetical protein